MRWFLLFAALLGFARPADAAPFASLQWNSCSDAVPRNLDYPGPGIVNQVVSIHGFAGTVTAVQFEIEVRGPVGFPDAWRFDAAGCNAGGMDFSLAAFGKTCPSVGSGSLLGTTYTWDEQRQTARARLVASIASAALDSAKTYVLGKLAYDQGACAGTEIPMCFELLGASVVDGEGREVQLDLGNRTITWQDASQNLTCHPTDFRGASIRKFLVSCLSDTVPQFIELGSTNKNDQSSASLHLRIVGRDGITRFDQGRLFGSLPDGSPWDGSWLCGTRGYEQRAGTAVDLRIPAALDPTGGRIELYEPGAGLLVDAVDYGPGTPNPLAPSGQALVRQPDGSLLPGDANATNASGASIPWSCPTIIIREFAQGCSDGAQDGWFLELEAVDDAVFDHLVRLEPYGEWSSGEINLFPGMADGMVWPKGRKWLIGTTSKTGFPLDRVLPFGPPHLIKLYAANGTLLDSLDWEKAVPVLHYGYSVERQTDFTWALQPAPSPTNYAGQSGAGTACYCPGPNCTDSTMSKIRIDEFATRCLNGETGSQYVVLRAMGPGQQFHKRAALRTTNANLENTMYIDPFVDVPEGTPWPEGQAYLFGGPTFEYASPVVPDQKVAEILDTRSGTIQFFDTRSGGPLVDIVRYGPGLDVPTPARGEAVRRSPGGTPVLTTVQNPENRAGHAATISSCPCGIRTLSFGGLTENPSPPAVRFDSTSFQTHYEYDASVGIQAARDSGNATRRTGGTVGTVFTVQGPIAGELVNLTAVLHVTGNASGLCSVYNCTHGVASAAIAVPGNSRGTGVNGPTDVTVQVPFQVKVGEPWRLDTHVEAILSGSSGEAPGFATVRAQFGFANVPPGLVIESCAGFRYDAATATRPAIVSSARDGAGVHLQWSAAADVDAPWVERSEDGVAWNSIGLPALSSPIWTFDDATGQADVRYGYRLAWRGGVSDETWVDPVPARLTMRVLGSPGTPALEFTLGRPERVRLELLDLRGRRVAFRDLGTQTAGVHRLDGLRAGVYWARLFAGSETRQLKLIVL